MSNIFDIVTARADYEQGAVVIIDQTQLPGREVYLALKTPEEIWEAIYLLKVRGAPAIGWLLLTEFPCVCKRWMRLMISTGSLQG